MPSSPTAPVYPPTTDAERKDLLQFLRSAPLAYGPWRTLKALYKQVEADPAADPEIAGTLLARSDLAGTTASSSHRATLQMKLGDIHAVTKTLLISGGKDGLACIFGSSKRYNFVQADSLRVCRLNDSDPLQPALIGQPVTFPSSQASGLTLCGTIAAVAVPSQNSRGGAPIDVRFYDLAPVIAGESNAPVRRGSVLFDASYVALTAVDSRPYVVAVLQGMGTTVASLRVISLADPMNPTVVGIVEIKDATGLTLSEDGRTAYVAVPTSTRHFLRTEPAGIRTVDLSDPTRPRVVASLPIEHIEVFDVQNGVLFVGTTLTRGGLIAPGGSNRAGGLNLYDVSQDPLRPRLLGNWQPFSGQAIKDIAVSAKGFAFIRVDWGLLYIVDIHDPRAPKSVSPQPHYLASPRHFMLNASGEVLYVAADYSCVLAWNVARPEKPVQVGTPPSRETIGYMKRRARRWLRTIAAKDADRYAQIAAATLLAVGRASKTKTVDTAHQWITVDMLYGGSDRYIQTQHGRGGYTTRRGVGPRLGYRRREERAPAAWNAHPELLSRLLKSSNSPVEVAEFALRALRANGQPLPDDISNDALEQWLTSARPLLTHLAVQLAARRPYVLSPQALADACYYAPPGRQRALFEAALSALDGTEPWRKFTTRLMERIQSGNATTDDGQSRFSRRAGRTILRATESLPQFIDSLTGETLLRLGLVAPLLRMNHPELDRLVASAARQAKSGELRTWISALIPVPAPRREPAFSALEAAVQGVVVPQSIAASLVLVGSDAFTLSAGWRILAASALSAEGALGLWNSLLDSPAPTPPLQAAMTSPYALSLLARAGISTEELGRRLGQRPFLVSLLTPESFAQLLDGGLPTEIVLRLVAAAPDALWAQFQPIWLRRLREGMGLTALWSTVPSVIAEDATGILERRLLNDTEMADTLLGIEAASDGETLLAIREPEFGPLLGRWLERRLTMEPGLFVRNAPLLLTAATHALPEVRDIALAQVARVGMGLSFALRLVESEIPPSLAAGRAFFESEPAGGDQERTYALALCDSPVAGVRALGRDFVAARWATLGNDALLTALFENPTPDVQRFVADRLESTDEHPAATPEFDRDVLRARNKARRAKEAVKRRQSVEQNVDIETLLSLARGTGTPRDAEWALSQLALRALSGEQIPGFALEGVAGG